MATPDVTLSDEKYCSNCGESIDENAEICPECGVRQAPPPTATGKDRVTAGVFALLLGGVGIHHFYLGNTVRGVVYLLFFWTFIPAIAGFIEGILYLLKSDAELQAKYLD